MISVIETKDGFEPISGNPTLDSLDGTIRAPLLVILHESWTDADRAKFGIYLVEPMEIPAGKDAVGLPRYERQGDKVVQVRDLVDLPAPTLPPLTARQIRLALLHGDCIAKVDPAIEAIPDEAQRAAVRIEWEYASLYERKNPNIVALGSVIGLSEAQIDELWNLGLSL